jgi:hypothetical protein
MSPQRVQVIRSSVKQQRPAVGSREPGELYTSFPDKQIGVIDAAKAPLDLIAVRFFSTTTNYVTGDYVHNAGHVYRANKSIVAGAFNSTDWDTAPTTGEYEPPIAAGTTADYWRGDKSWQTLNKSAVGLGAVDNTSDASKPVSTATQVALDLKANLASPTFTGDPQAPTPTAGDSDTSIATTAFVANAVAAIGVGGMSTAEYNFSTTTTAPPSTGQLRGNSATQSAITAFYLHETNAVGVDITNALKIIAGGVKILVQDKTNSANVQYYVTSGPAVDNGAYFTIPVTWTATGSGTPFTAGRVIFAGFGIGSNNMLEAPTDGQIYGRRGSDASWQIASGGGASVTISDAAPGSPTAGALWWQSSTGRLMIYYTDANSSAWIEASGGGTATDEVVGGLIAVGASAPTSPAVGDIWIDTN